jgi:hypothetical protein
MRNRLWVFAVLAATGLLVIAYWWAREGTPDAKRDNQPGTTGTTAAVPDTSAVAMEHKLGQLEHRLQLLGDVVKQLQPNTTVEPNQPHACPEGEDELGGATHSSPEESTPIVPMPAIERGRTTATTAPGDPASEAEDWQEDVQFASKMDGVLRAGRRDAAREAKVRADLRELESAEVLGRPAVTLVECSAELCKIGVRFASASARDGFFGSFSMFEPWFSGGQMMVRRLAPDSLEVESYFAVKGGELPSPDAPSSE